MPAGLPAGRPERTGDGSPARCAATGNRCGEATYRPLHEGLDAGRPADGEPHLRAGRAVLRAQGRDDRDSGWARAGHLRRVGATHPATRRRPRRPRDLRRRARRHVRLEHGASPRAVLRRAVHRPRPAHAEHPPVPGAAHLHRQPRRRRGDLRRPLAARPARPAAPDVRATAPPRADGRRQGRDPRRPRRPRAARLRDAARCRVAGRVRRRRRVAGGQHVLHERHDGEPEGRRLQPSQHVPAHDGRDDGRLARRSRVRPHPAGRADVPRQRVGPRPRRGGGRRRPDHARTRPVGEGDRRPRRRRAGHGRRRCADDLDAGAARAEGSRHVAPAGDPVRRVGRAACAVRGATASSSACRSCRRGG